LRFRGDFDDALRTGVFKDVQYVLQGIGFHIFAHRATACEGFLWEFGLQDSSQPTLGEQEERVSFRFAYMVEHLAGATDIVGFVDHC